MAWALDLDGVMWLEDDPIPGAAGAIARLRAAGEHVGFVTNFSFSLRDELAQKLERHGIDASDGVITSAMAAAALVPKGARALVCAGPGVVDELQRRDIDTIDASDPQALGAAVDVVVVGYHPSFDYQRMTAAAVAVRAGARLLGTNDDATYPTAAGPLPGGGALLASIVVASGVTPEVAGKPHQPIADMVHALLGPDGIMVGDRPDTDGLFARTLGWKFGLVLTGVTQRSDLPVNPTPDVVSDSLESLVSATLSNNGLGR
ncbi:MAG: HAD-IIA family hydrolase [Acidimicrobiales bacterium]